MDAHAAQASDGGLEGAADASGASAAGCGGTSRAQVRAFKSGSVRRLARQTASAAPATTATDTAAISAPMCRRKLVTSGDFCGTLAFSGRLSASALRTPDIRPKLQQSND
jgi:hypothetical protein